jgi:Spy/CpxP family protein refolding chaperone
MALAVAMLVALGAKHAAEEVKAQGGLVESIQDLNLTEEQETKIANIMKEFRPRNETALKELTTVVKEEMDKVGAVLTPAQKDKLQSVREERRELRDDSLAHRIAHLKELDLTDEELTKIGDIRSEFRPKMVAALKGLEGLLSDEQKRAREEGLKAGKRRKEVLESLKLTNEQKDKIVTVGKEMSTLVREEMEKIRDVLTAGQREKLQELRDERKEQVRDRMAQRIATLRDLNLTDEQKTKITDIRKEYRPKIQEAGNKLRASVREELEMIVAVIKG